MAKSERTHSLEETLAKHLTELKSWLTDEDIQSAIQETHSLGRLKTVEEYKRDREHAIHILQQVAQPQSITIQWQGLRNEVESCLLPEYTPNNLVLLLHQYFCDRVSQLVQLKHNIQVRWARFALNDPKIYTELNDSYQKCIKNIFDEYNNSLNHARRLSVVLDLHIAGKPCPLDLIGEEEVRTYLRWLTHLFHTTKQVTAFITQIQLLPLLNQEQPDAPSYKPQTVSKNQAKWIGVGNKMRHLSQSLLPGHSASSMSIGLSSQPSGANLVSPSALGPIDQEDVPTSSLPMINTELENAKSKLHQLMMTYSIRGTPNTDSSSEQLKLYYTVFGQFKTVFQQQIESTTLFTYDAMPKGTEQKVQRSNISFRKLSNWLEYVQLRPKPDPLQVKCYIQIKELASSIDPILALCSQCTHLNNIEKTLYSLSQHYEIVHNQKEPTSTSVSGNSKGKDPMLIWKCIYGAVDMRNPMNIEQSSNKFTLHDDKKPDLNDTRGKAVLPQAMQLLGEEDGRKISLKAQNTPQDAYFAFILLRHLRIRDIRIKCLTLINYMCSVERTLTINATGLSQKPDRNTGFSIHLFKTPVDYIMNESEFMQYPEVENHDDYYSFDENLIRVWDGTGKLIIYDTAEDRLKTLEEELLTIVTYYIQKDILAMNKKKTTDSEEDINISSFSQPKLDRFTILLDIWIAQSRFMEEKIKLINLYLEAYHSVYDKREKSKLAQIITNLIALSPRYDPQAQYFTEFYEKETSCLKAQFESVQPILKQVLETERLYNQTVCDKKCDEKCYGLPPFKIIENKLINLSGDLRTDVSHYLLECCNSLSVVALLPALIQNTLQMAIGLGDIHGVSKVVAINTRLWLKVEDSWAEMRPLGSEFSKDIQHKIFSPIFIEYPRYVIDLLDQHIRQTDSKHEQSTPHEKQKGRILAYCDILQLITSRHQLLLSCHRSAALHQLYKRQIQQLEEEDHHPYLRFVPFNHSARLQTDKSLNSFVKNARDPKTASQSDSYSLPYVPMAVQELDDSHVGRLSFHCKEDVIRILISKSGIRNLMVTLQAQVSYQNALLIICQQCAAIIRYTGPLVKNRKFTSFSQLTSAASEYAEHIQLIYLLQGSFLSFQKEKAAVRDHMLALFTTLPSSSLRGQEETELGKCALISKYNCNLITSLSNYSLRHQIVIVYHKLTTLLEDYPSTRDAYFTIGGVTIPSPVHSNEPLKTSRGRVKAVFSQDGKRIINLFFIPHVSEVITMFSSLSIEEQTESLNNLLQIASYLLDIITYACAVAKLGPMCNSVGIQTSGTEDIGGEIHIVQSQISQLKNPNDPKEVISLLSLHCSCLLLSHDVAIRHYLRKTLLHNRNDRAIQTLDSICIPGLDNLLTTDSTHSLTHPLITLPAPLNSDNSSDVVPWRHHLMKYGGGLVAAGPLVDVFSNIFISVAPLNPTGRQAASGELLAMSLLQEDVLFSSDLANKSKSLPRAPSTISRLSRISHSFQLTRGSSQWGGRSRISTTQSPSTPLPPLPPISANKLIVRFLTVTTQVEQLRYVWGCGLLGVGSIMTHKGACHLDDLYQAKVLNVARRLVARQEAKSLMRLQMENETLDGGSGSLATLLTETDITWESLEQTQGLNELMLRETQLSRLRDLVDQQLIQAEIKYVSQLLQLSLQELQRDTDTLPLDLWKRPSMKDIPGVPRPHIVEEFVDSLQNGMSSVRGSSVVELPQDHFTMCVNQLSSGVLSREKECYQLYATYYESTIQSLYHQLYLKNQEVQSYRQQVQSLTEQNNEDGLVLAADYTHELLLEIMALRVTISQLKQQLKEKKDKVRQSIIKEYDSLMNELHASSVTLKGKYEQYRQKLYNEIVSNLYKSRQNVVANITALKDKLSSRATIDEQTMSGIEAKEHQEIQQENTHLSHMLYKLKSLHQWRRTQQETIYTNQELTMKKELDDLQNDYIRLKMESEQEKNTLKQQVKELQRNLANEDLKYDVLQKTMEEERNKKVVLHKSGTKGKVKMSSKLEQMHEEKFEELLHTLDEKEQQVQSLSANQDQEMQKAEYEKKKAVKAIRQAKQCLSQERHLKIDAFHQIEGLITQVHEYEQQHSPPQGRSTTQSPSLFTLTREGVSMTPSSIRSATPVTPARHDITSTHSLKLQRPRSEQGRLRTVTPNEVSSITQEIGALKLI